MRTRSKKKIRENLNRLPREVEATLPSWVKCTDPISAETLEEVRSTVLMWLENVRNYKDKLYEDLGSPDHAIPTPDHPCLIWMIYAHCDQYSGVASLTPLTAMSYVDSPICWSTFIRRMILSDVNIYRYRWRSIVPEAPRDVEVVDIYVGSRHEYKEVKSPRDHSDESVTRLIVQFHDTLSSEIKDEICSKLASALRALKSRISRICGINELERRTQSH